MQKLDRFLREFGDKAVKSCAVEAWAQNHSKIGKKITLLDLKIVQRR